MIVAIGLGGKLFKKTIILMATLALALAPFEDTRESSAQNKRSIIKEDSKLFTHPVPRYGGTLAIGDSNQPTLINPILTDHSISASVVSLVFNGLVRVTPAGELEPDLALEWNVSEDGLVYTFLIRQGVKFHDGSELTAEDIVFSYQQLQDPSVDSPYFKDFEIIERFEAPDRYTFRAFLKSPLTSVLVKFAKRMVIPKHLYDKGSLYQNEHNYSPIGTGPFRFAQWNKDQIILEANENYFEGRPYLDKIIFRVYNNLSEVWSAFMRQEIDLVRFIKVEDYEVTRKDPVFNTFSHAGLVYCAVLYNLKDPILSDKRVRQALACAVNKRRIIEKVEKGYGVESFGPFSEESWGFNPEVEPYSYDPQKAASILEEAGWKEKDPDGIRIKEGVKLVLRLLVDSRSEKLKTIAMLLRQELQEAGIALQVRLYHDDETLARESPAAQAQLRMEFGGGADPDEVAKLWHSDQWRKSRLWDPGGESAVEIDRLVDLGRTTQDRETRKKIYHEFHAKIYQEQPACFLYFPSFFHAAAKKVQNADLFLNPRMPDYILKDFYLDSNKGGGDHRGDNQQGLGQHIRA